MAQSMKDIKSRIRGISNIKQITNAMELVSSAKLRKSRNQLEETRPYYETVVEGIKEILAETKGVNHPLLQKRELKNRAIIVLTADRGLAGGYNINVIRKAEEIMKSDNVNNILITSGTKAKDYFKHRHIDVFESITNIAEKPTYDDARKISRMVFELYTEKKVDEVMIVYTRFNSVMSLEPKVERLLPVDSINHDKNRKPLFIEYEPEPEVILEKMINQYVGVSIFGFLLESAASEQAARRTAMENATDNAGELIDDLKLSYNRARQASITQEISEIVGGAEALK